MRNNFLYISNRPLFHSISSPILNISSYQIEEYYDGSKVDVNQLSYNKKKYLNLSLQQVAVCLTNVDTFWPSLFFLGSISIFFFIPLFILIILYSVIAKHLMANPSLISTHSSRSNFIKYRKQVILMLAAVVVSFFTCLLPFRAFTLWIILVPSDTLTRILSNQRSKNWHFFLCPL
jgi:7 transmembrane receptor (rhodopsin family)